MAFIDLHAHTTASDGSLTPTELVELACQTELAAIAVTDHDTTDGVPEAQNVGKRLGIEVVPAIEISASWPKGSLHILGYLLDIANPTLQARLGELRAARDNRNPRILARLAELGVPVSMDEVRTYAGGEVIGRRHIAAAMLARGYVKTPREAFERFLGEGGAAYFDKECLPPAVAIAAIHAAGGLAVLAHPRWLRSDSDSELEWNILQLQNAGIDGIECYHSDHDPSDQNLYEKLARRYELLITGGSDFHGHAKADIRLGRGRGNVRVPAELLQRLKDAQLARQSKSFSDPQPGKSRSYSP